MNIPERKQPTERDMRRQGMPPAEARFWAMIYRAQAGLVAGSSDGTESYIGEGFVPDDPTSPGEYFRAAAIKKEE